MEQWSVEFWQVEFTISNFIITSIGRFIGHLISSCFTCWILPKFINGRNSWKWNHDFRFQLSSSILHYFEWFDYQHSPLNLLFNFGLDGFRFCWSMKELEIRIPTVHHHLRIPSFPFLFFISILNPKLLLFLNSPQPAFYFMKSSPIMNFNQSAFPFNYSFH